MLRRALPYVVATVTAWVDTGVVSGVYIFKPIFLNEQVASPFNAPEQLTAAPAKQPQNNQVPEKGRE
ncbi:uncharacterized protein LACBIDRAFT_301259 [Laccaria bicolor S238N-H82]|uniref:Predicted protein n=1 Tax=Laccaria bicolor (strain S238N-H82 / ATCC MYA-4686) TaxID=486041 RepID=B0CRR0_LACBS|nr:uncharacterized protein LACBIDRAFT_301259 [Laccaria bicolor S238N-H82]EDR15866.1 predicted protein [Laccaria bicolor S238N-H82]|eukprot:XP_001874074.1 predicted protein [Laccaria bicolor S238N-H82]